MKKNEIQLLLVVIGILAVVVSWQLVYNNFQEKTEIVEEQNVALKERLDQLELLNARQAEYVAETERMKTESDALIATYPAGFRNEDIIMYLYNMELIGENEVAISVIDMEEESEVPYTGIMNVGGYDLVDDGIKMFRNKNTMTFTTTYNGLKNILNYIYGIDTRKAVSTVNVTANDEGFLEGNIDLNFFCLTGTGFSYVETNIFGVPTGTENFFGVRNGTLADVVPEGEEGAEGEEGEAAEGEGVGENAAD